MGVIPLNQLRILHIPPTSTKFINSTPHFRKIDKIPTLPYFRKIYKFTPPPILVEFAFFAAPYFHHDAFMQSAFLINLRFLLPLILTLVHLCVMLYTYWTPLAAFNFSNSL